MWHLVWNYKNVLTLILTFQGQKKSKQKPQTKKLQTQFYILLIYHKFPKQQTSFVLFVDFLLNILFSLK